MKTVTVLSLMILFASSFGNNEVVKSQNDRSLLNLALMIARYVDCPFPWFPIPYGCWCGITVPFPSPYEPIDAFDGFCKVHDYCYEDVAALEECGELDEYIYDYDWEIVDGEIVCHDENHPCQNKICECDKAVVVSIAEDSKASGCRTSNPGCSEMTTIAPNNSQKIE